MVNTQGANAQVDIECVTSPTTGQYNIDIYLLPNSLITAVNKK